VLAARATAKFRVWVTRRISCDPSSSVDAG
jgi:hypothetical protein